MPKLPTYDAPTVEERPVGTPYSGVRATPNDYGAAIGQGIEQAGQAAAKVYQEEKQKTDAARVQDAYAKLGDWKNQNVYNPDGGALSVKGENAVGITPKYVGDFEKYAKDVEAELSNDDQKQTFAHIFRQERQSLDQTLSSHERQQHEVYAAQSYQAALGTAVSNAANAYKGDDQAIREASLIGRNSVYARAKTEGWSSAELEANLRAFDTKVHSEVVSRLAQDDGVAAKKYLERNGGQIDGAAKDQLTKLVEVAEVRDHSRSEADKLAADHPGDLTAQLEAAKAIKETKVYDETVKRLEATDTIAKKMRAENDEKNFGPVSLQVVSSGGYLDKSTPNYQALSDGGKAKAQELALRMRREGKTTDAAARREQAEANKLALSQFMAIEDPTERLKVNPTSEYPGADEATQNRIKALQNGVRKTVQGGGIAKLTEVEQSASVAATQLGLEKTDAVNLKAHLFEWREDYLKAHAGKEPTRKELDAAIAENVLKGNADGKSHWYGGGSYKFQAKPGEPFKAFGGSEQPYQKNQTVRVRAPNGQTGTIPAANLDAWLKKNPGGKRL